jgi:hypothetical protein
MVWILVRIYYIFFSLTFQLPLGLLWAGVIKCGLDNECYICVAKFRTVWGFQPPLRWVPGGFLRAKVTEPWNCSRWSSTDDKNAFSKFNLCLDTFLTLKYFSACTYFNGDTRWRSWLRQCATSRKVAVSIPDSVTGIFHWHNPSSRTVAMGLTQPVIKMSTRNIFWE